MLVSRANVVDENRLNGHPWQILNNGPCISPAKLEPPAHNPHPPASECTRAPACRRPRATHPLVEASGAARAPGRPVAVRRQLPCLLSPLAAHAAQRWGVWALF